MDRQQKRRHESQTLEYKVKPEHRVNDNQDYTNYYEILKIDTGPKEKAYNNENHQVEIGYTGTAVIAPLIVFENEFMPSPSFSTFLKH